MASLPAMWMEPVRRPVRPTMARIVVVRPAPLRPSRETTSPWPTLMFTPCSTCDSPYQAFRFSMRRRSAAMSVGTLEDRIGCAHVGLDHLRIARDLGIRAVGDDRAALQHRDAVG